MNTISGILKKFMGYKKHSAGNVKKVGDFFYKELGTIKIYTHDLACINSVFRHVFERGIYNFNSMSESPFIIDAGANIGLGVLYWKHLYPKAKIIAFEPSKLTYVTLEKNVKENKLTDVICINKALSDKEGKQPFTTNEKISGSLIVEKNLPVTYEVETTTLAPYLQQKVDLLKIDIEGAEKYIIEDIRNNINNLNHIFLEYHSFVSNPQYLSRYLQMFEENGFRYYIEDESKKTNQFLNHSTELNQDMKLNIWAHR